MTLTRIAVAERTSAVRLPTTLLPGGFDTEPLALERLERANALLRAAFETVGMPVAVLDENGTILLVNARWREVAGPSDDVMKRDGIGAGYLDAGLLRAMMPRHAAALRIGLRKVFRRTTEACEHRVRVKRTGSDRWYRVLATRVVLDGLHRIVVSHEDVTALHAAEETAKAMSRRLLRQQEEERQRIAVELHDSTCQQLTAAGLHLLALRRTSQSDPFALRTIDQIGGMIDEAQKEIRSLSYLLHPPYLDRDGLRKTLTRFVEGYGARTGLRTTVQISDEVDSLSPAAHLALLRIVQEALSNVHRHAGATRVLVRMRTTRTMLFFTVRDDGRGMGHPAGRGRRHDCPIGLGVPGMYARVGQLGGTLRILSGARGTTLSGKLPLGRCEA